MIWPRSILLRQTQVLLSSITPLFDVSLGKKLHVHSRQHPTCFDRGVNFLGRRSSFDSGGNDRQHQVTSERIILHVLVERRLENRVEGEQCFVGHPGRWCWNGLASVDLAFSLLPFHRMLLIPSARGGLPRCAHPVDRISRPREISCSQYPRRRG